MDIGKVIITLREKRGLSQGRLSELAGVSQTFLSLIENGKKNPSATTIGKICKALDIPKSMIHLYMVDPEDVPPENKEPFDEFWPIAMDHLHRIFKVPSNDDSINTK